MAAAALSARQQNEWVLSKMNAKIKE